MYKDRKGKVRDKRPREAGDGRAGGGDGPEGLAPAGDGDGGRVAKRHGGARGHRGGRAFTTDLDLAARGGADEEAGGGADAEEGSSEEPGSGSEEEEALGVFASGGAKGSAAKAKAAAKKAQRGGAKAGEPSAADSAAASPGARGGRGRGRGRGRGAAAARGLDADFPRSNLVPAAAAAEDDWQGRGGRGGRGARGGRGVDAGRGGRGERRPAFNPFDIRDEDLLKGGKKSAAMPRTGNRTHTFK
jgi:hypothetical protein